MKERPILFSAPMVRALLDGTKTQTRRVANTGLYAIDARFHGVETAARELDALSKKCPFGQPGDRLWVREAWRTVIEADPLPPRLMTAAYRLWFEANSPHQPGFGKLRPSMFMPRWASRINLELTGVRVERLQDISEADAWAEGIEAVDGALDDLTIIRLAKSMGLCSEDAVPTYAALWESLNGDGSWDANPWVWVVEFKKQETENAARQMDPYPHWR